MISVGNVYIWNREYPSYLNNFKNRYYKVLSVTVTHLYIQNLRNGSTFNVDLKTFKRCYDSVILAS